MSDQPQKQTRRIDCPQCGEPVVWSSAAKWRPFCSERCRMIDLGEWLDEAHRIAGESVPIDDLETP